MKVRPDSVAVGRRDITRLTFSTPQRKKMEMVGCGLHPSEKPLSLEIVRTKMAEIYTLGWTFRISSGVSQGIDKSVVQSDWEFLNVGVGGSTLYN